VLPENVPAISVFIGVFSQWDTAGMDGIRTGIKREAIPMAMAARRIPPEQLGDIVARLEILERAALSHWASTRPSK
jgi:hypothetical protein